METKSDCVSHLVYIHTDLNLFSVLSAYSVLLLNFITSLELRKAYCPNPYMQINTNGDDNSKLNQMLILLIKMQFF